MKKQTSYIGIAKSACALLLCLAMLICVVPPIQVSAEATASAEYVGSDAETKGAWEGKYGKDTAYLVLYKFDVTNAKPSANNHNRFADFCSTYDLMIQSGDSKIASITNATSKAWCWAAEAGDEAVLDMPSGSNLTPFYAYAKDASDTKFTVTATDETAVHAFTVYGTNNPVPEITNYDPRNGVTITITDENGSVLLTESLASDVFDGGKYLTYNVTGSFVFTLSENVTTTQRGGFGVNAIFIDPVVNGITNENFSEILATGGSYVLGEDITCDTPVALENGTTLDLNGHKLTVPSVMGAGGSIIDTSSEKSGRIACTKGLLMLSADNSYLPIWDGESYLLSSPSMTDAYFNLVSNNNGFVITSRPGFGKSNDINVATYLATGNSGVEMDFVLSWMDVFGNQGNKEFGLDALIQDVYGSIGTTNLAFQGTFRNPGDTPWFRVDVKIESCGVVVDSSAVATDAKIKYNNPNEAGKTYLFAHDFNETNLEWTANALAGKRGDSITSQSTSGSYDYPTFDGTSMILNGAGNVNLINLPITSIEVGTKLVIEADVTLHDYTGGNIEWLGKSSQITSASVLVTGSQRTTIPAEFVIRSEVQKEADGTYTITTTIVDTVTHTATATAFPTALVRRNRNTTNMSFDYLLIYTEAING